jgi:hypothetical protein
MEFTKKELQDFNVAHGLARSARETKEKTMVKTEKILTEIIKSAGAENVTITIDRTATSTIITTTINRC